MPPPIRPAPDERSLQGFQFFRPLAGLLDHLRDQPANADRAGNRRLHFDQYTALLLLYFFNPLLTSLRALQQASALDKVQRLLGCERAALGSLSAAARVFDPQLLRPILGVLAEQALPVVHGQEAEALRGLTTVDGSLLPALPKMAWALFQDDRHRAAKMHVSFDVLRGVPEDASVTPGSTPEQEELRRRLQAGRCYVIDRGYAVYQLFQDIHDAGATFVGRVRDDAAYQVEEERPLSQEARSAGVLRDAVVRLGADSRKKALLQPVRLVWVSTGRLDKRGQPEVLVLASNRLDLSAELVALAYRYRWSIELFFRWLKCVLGCRHLLSTCQNGVTLQVYVGIIASLLLSLYTGKKPTKRTFEMLCLYLSGLANLTELQAHLDSLPDRPPTASG